LAKRYWPDGNLSAVMGQAMNQKLVAVVAIAMCALLCGCEVPAQLAARQNLDESDAAYEQCLASHGSGSIDCQSAQQSYESSRQAYDQPQPSSAFRPAPPRPQQPGEPGWTP
jgi:hypothetical protein